MPVNYGLVEWWGIVVSCILTQCFIHNLPPRRTCSCNQKSFSLLAAANYSHSISVITNIDWFFSLSLSSFSVCKQEKQQFQHLTNFFLPSLNITPINMESEREKSFFMAERWKLTISTSNTRKTREQERKKEWVGVLLPQ